MENLEVMAVARRYNAFLRSLIEAEIASTADRHLAIDFGAGLGTFTGSLLPRFHQVIAVEIEQASQEALRRRGIQVVDSLASIPSGAADFIHSLNVLEHIDDDAAALADMRRVLRPGARLLLYVPAFHALWTVMDDLVGHVRRYDRRTLCTRLQRAGFDVKRAQYVDCLGAAAAVTYRLCGGSGRLNEPAVAAYDRWCFPLSRLADRALDRLVGKNLLVTATA